MQASRSCTRLFTRLVASRVAARCQRSSPLTSAAKPDQLILPQGTTLPHVVTLTNGPPLRIENVTEDRATEVWKLLHDTTEKGEGYSVGEIETLDEFKKNMSTEKGYFQILNHDNGDLVCALVLKPSPLCRSEHTVHFAGPIAVGPAYRGKGIGSGTLYKVYTDLGRLILGHPGFTCARTVLGRSLNAIRNTGATFHGLIPFCSYLEGKGWMHDLTITTVDPRAIKNRLGHVPVPDLPPLQRTEVTPPELQAANRPINSFPQLDVNGHTLDIQYANDIDIWRVEEMMRSAAEQSDGFAIDEFNEKGHFNRKFFYDSNVVVAKTSDDVIVATAIFGPTKLCRARNEKQIAIYTLVNPDFRRKGLGSTFLKYLSKEAKNAGCTSILTDAFATNVAAHQLLYKNDFIITGTLPQCGMLKNKGYTDSYMFWRSLW